MDPIADAPAAPDAGDDRPTLVLQNGRQSGARRPLGGPLTLVGRSADCDVQIDFDGVQPVHCVLIDSAEGLLLRDLGSDLGTLVNDERVPSHLLRDGDRITVGPFSFVLELPEEILAEEVDTEAEREALRVQAAAVAAQQAALDEEEQRLRQEAVSLERQRQQLATHLEERRCKLHEMREELKAERERVDADRAAVEQERRAAAAMNAEAEQDRRRFAEVRRKLERRRQRQSAAQEATFRKRERALAMAQEGVQRQAEELKRDRAALDAARLRFNGEAELSRRQLREEWEQLALSQQQWEATLDQEQRERVRREQALDGRARVLERAEQALADEQRRWVRRRLDLEKEAAGLETRVRNLRALVAEQQAALPPPRVSEPAPPPGPTLPAEAPAPERVQRLAGQLADQRLHLLEQWQALLTLHADYRQEHGKALAEVEEAVDRLDERERQVVRREEATETREAELRRREEALAQTRLSLEGWQLRLTAEATAWEAERYALLTELQGREAIVARQMYLLEALRHRWVRRRRREIERQKQFRARCEEVRRQYVARWEECLIREAELNRGQRALAAHEAALECYRLEHIARAPDAAAAEKRIEKLRRQEEELFAAADRALERDQQAVLDEGARLDEQARQLQHFADELGAEQQAWERRRAGREARRAAAEGEGQRHRLELHRLRLRHQQDQQQLAEMRAEVERIARLLIDGGEAPLALPAPKAA